MRTIFLVILIVQLIPFARAQNAGDIRESFNEGEFFFNRGDYKEASFYFRKVVDRDPDNANYNFKLGECYMNIPGEESLAVKCFEKAVGNTVAKNKYRGKDFEEKSAPLHAWFYLGNVYRMNNRLDDALKAYDSFVNSPFYYGNYNVNIVENEIKSCERAKIILDSPVAFDEVMLDTVINTTASEIFPVVTPDGQSMVFVRRLKFYDAIFFTAKKDSSWDQPVNLNPLIGSDGEFYPVSLSHDGNELYLVRRTMENSDLYVSYRRNGAWSKAESLNKHINTQAGETWASISGDKQTLWFTSSRKGSVGGLDIYYAQRDKTGEWGKARNAGKIINTPFDEDSPCITRNGQTLFFSSKGHYSMGGYDIFFSTRVDKAWGDPVNIGSPINNTSDNLGFVPLSSGESGYYSRISMGEGTSEDIYYLTLKAIKPTP